MNSLTFQEKIKYNFKDQKLIKSALTHSSYFAGKGDKGSCNNERLEFLGDAFFDAIIGEALYRRLPDVEEGVLTKIRAKVVCEMSLAEQGNKLQIGDYMLMGHGEEKSGGRRRDSIVADAMEAVIGALFLDGGYEIAKKFVMNLFGETIEDAMKGKLYTDYKSEIQERIQGGSHKLLSYKVVKEEGPDHDKIFHVDLMCDDEVIGRGIGRSKKEAERNAAKEALERGDALVL